MPLAETTRNFGASIIRNIPYFHGLGRVYRLFNEVMLNLGAQPIVTAKMKDGTFMRVDLRTNTEFNAYYRGEYNSDLIRIVCSLFDCSTSANMRHWG